MNPVSGLSNALRRVVGSQSVATIDTLYAAAPPSPLAPVDLTDADEINAVLDLGARIGDILLSCGTSNADTRAHIHAVTEAYGVFGCHVDITLNTITIYTTSGPGAIPFSIFRVASKIGIDFNRLEEVDQLVRSIISGATDRPTATKEVNRITQSPPNYKAWFTLLTWGVFTFAVAFIIGGGWLVGLIALVAAMAIMSGMEWLAGKHLPLFFQNIYAGFAAVVPAAVAYQVGGHFGVSILPSQIIAAELVAVLAGLTLVQALQDGITGAPVTASARFFEAALITGGLIAGVALGINIANKFGIQLPPIETISRTSFSGAIVSIIASAAAGALFSIACYARLRSTFVISLSTMAGATVFYAILRPLGLGLVFSSAISAVLVGLAGGLLSRRYGVPPLITAVSGITPFLPGLMLYRGMYALLNDQAIIGFTNLASAFAVATALASGLVLGEWVARRLRRPRIMTAYQVARRTLARPIPVVREANAHRRERKIRHARAASESGTPHPTRAPRSTASTASTTTTSTTTASAASAAQPSGNTSASINYSAKSGSSRKTSGPSTRSFTAIISNDPSMSPPPDDESPLKRARGHWQTRRHRQVRSQWRR